MAPEQLTRGEATIQSDLFALGLILSEIFTGRTVLKAGSIPDEIRAHESSLSQTVTFTEDVDSTVQRVIRRCLEREPHDRPASARAVAAGLPGGDPLAAALAAGETPSPEMVAASGATGQLSLRTARMEDNPSHFVGPELPLDQVSWEDAQQFLARLNESGLTEDLKFVLPTQAQWETACRAGTTTLWHSGHKEEDFSKCAWFKGNSNERSHPVGQLQPNAFGLYDMHGNVWEWCADGPDSQYAFRGGGCPQDGT